jgi:glycosyltransferase involved in cell wall biosynthesis
MRILIANEAFAGGGGVETYLATLVPALQAAGHEVGVLHDNPACETGPQRIAPETVWRVGVRDEGLERAMARVRAFAPDICFSHNMRALAIDARLMDEWPVVKMMHGHFGTCVSGHKAFAFPAVVGCTRAFGPGCLAHYLPRRCGEANPLAMIRQYRWGSSQRSLFDRYRAVVVASRFMRAEYLRAGLPHDRVHAIPLFAPPHAWSNQFAEGPRPIDVVFLGRMTPLKGPGVLIAAAALAAVRLGRRVSVVLAGDGPERDRLSALAAPRGVDARFAGWLKPAERDRLLRQAALLAVPSQWPEPFGLVGLEAGIFGTPAVAFDVGGIADWLADGENGRLIDPALGAVGLGDAIAGLLRDSALCVRLGAGARAAAARFSLDAHLRALAAILKQAVAADAAVS